MSYRKSSTIPGPWLVIGIVLLAILIVLVISGILISRYFGRPDSASAFGDMFGAANALFSGLAFAGVIYTLIQQSREFNLHREEFDLQRKEMIATQQLTTASILFEYYNEKISSLKTAQARKDGYTEGRQKEIDQLIEKHHRIRKVLEQLYEELTAPQSGDK
jgi:hypothetical protein